MGGELSLGAAGGGAVVRPVNSTSPVNPLVGSPLKRSVPVIRAVPSAFATKLPGWASNTREVAISAIQKA